MGPDHSGMQSLQDERERLQPWIDRMIVVDTLEHHIYIGLLTSIDSNFIELADVDVHDVRESRFTKDQYIHQARKQGNSSNRRHTLLYKNQVVSLSLLEDVIKF